MQCATTHFQQSVPLRLSGYSYTSSTRYIIHLASALHGQLGNYDAQHIFWTGENYNDLTQALLQEVQAQRHFDSIDSNCTWYLLERTIAKKAWLNYCGQVAPIWSYEDAAGGRRPKIVTF